MDLSPVPIYMVAAVIAWFSLIAVEFYERLFRNKIEDNRERLWRYVESQTAQIKQEIKVPSDPRSLSIKLNELNTLVKRPDDFLKWRKLLVVAVVGFGGFAAYVSYDPFSVIWLLSNIAWLAIVFFLVMLANGVFIYHVFNVDEKISELLREDQRLKYT